MLPTLEINDRLLVNKFVYRFQEPQRKDIILFDLSEDQLQSESTFIKRIIGLPGENLEVKAGRVYVNNQPLQEDDYIAERPLYNWGSEQIPANSYFILGDNRNNSYDSHYWGFLPKDRIIGKATKIFWPPNRIGVIE